MKTETAPITTLSSRGQVVIPEEVRRNAGFAEGCKFVVFATFDSILLKKIEIPDAKKAFNEMRKYAFKIAKEKGLKEKDVEKIIHRKGANEDSGSKQSRKPF